MKKVKGDGGGIMCMYIQDVGINGKKRLADAVEMPPLLSLPLLLMLPLPLLPSQQNVQMVGKKKARAGQKMNVFLNFPLLFFVIRRIAATSLDARILSAARAAAQVGSPH
jgi:hypothetical protein